MNYKTIDLFCGAGGFSKGFQMAGFQIKFGIDIWNDAVVTYQKNFPEAKAINKDIQALDGRDILSISEIESVDVIIGGPPCQGFSVSGKRMVDDERNSLYKSYVRIVSQLKPKIFVMENVPGLVNLFDGQVGREVIEDFSSIGYNVEKKILSADNYGVPQQRKRVFFVGLNKSIFGEQKFIFPSPTTGEGTGVPVVTCKDAISDLDFIPDDVRLGEKIDYQIAPQSEYQKEMRKSSKFVLNHTVTIHSEKTKSIISMVPDGGNYKNLPEEFRNTRKVHIAWTRMNSKKPCFTIDTGHNHHFHYSENRVPTVRESARIQSFPDDFEFIGGKTSQLKQVGNAVPPLLAKAIADSVYELLEKRK